MAISRSEFDALKARVTKLEAANTATNTQIAALKAADLDLDARIDKLEGGTSPPPPTNIYDDFKYTETFVSGQDSNNGKWHTDFVSNGFAKTDGNGLIIAPSGPTLRSVQVKSTQQWGDAKFTFDITTEKQVVTQNADGSPRTPTQWMCGWTLFRHLDKRRHYYIYVGLDHIEFGKKDAPELINGVPITQAQIETYQRILWGGGPNTPLGQKRTISIETKGDTFKIICDGTTVMTMTDVSSFKNGSLSPYAEGSQARYQNIKVETL